MIGKMAIATVSPEFNDLGRSVTPIFLYRNIVYLQLFPNCSKLNKKQCGKLKKKKDFFPRDIESCHLVSARRVKLWSLNTNLFFGNLT